MKHSILGMSVLAIVVTLACCSKNDAANDSQGNLVDRKTNQYRTDFEAKYGKVGSTQSWDFSGVSTTTRAAASTTVSNIKDPEFFQNHLHNDMAGLKAGISNAQELDWNPNVSVNLYPAFCHDSDEEPVSLPGGQQHGSQYHSDQGQCLVEQTRCHRPQPERQEHQHDRHDKPRLDHYIL